VLVAVVAAAFGAGLLVGQRDGERAAPTGRLDEAADRIEVEGLHPVDRQALDAAAIKAMLEAANDQWGNWQPLAPAAPTTVVPTVLVHDVGSPTGTVTVIEVTAFDRGTGKQVRTAVQNLPTRSAGVVLDLRGNGGGLLDEAVETASAFLDGGLVVTAQRRDGSSQPFDAIGEGNTSTPLAVLVDGGTASASEIVAGALLDHGRGVLVGSRTYGKGTVQEPALLSDGSELSLTVASYRTPSGRNVDGIGLDPDIEVAPGSAPAVALDRAVAVLPGLLASTAGGS
jgi:hypothetical protein